MDSIRFWIGGMLCVAVFLMLATLNVIPGYDFPRHGCITGHVTMDGRPITSGMVFLISTEGEHLVLARGPIDRNGDYLAYTTWPRRWERGAHFTLWVVPHSLRGAASETVHSAERDPLKPHRSRRLQEQEGADGEDAFSANAAKLKISQVAVDLDPSMHHVDINLTNDQRLVSLSSKF